MSKKKPCCQCKHMRLLNGKSFCSHPDVAQMTREKREIEITGECGKHYIVLKKKHKYPEDRRCFTCKHLFKFKLSRRTGTCNHPSVRRQSLLVRSVVSHDFCGYHEYKK